MLRTRFTEDQIIAMIKDREAGMSIDDICIKHEVSRATFYKLKAASGGAEIQSDRRLKALQDENEQLKRILGATLLDNAVLKDRLRSQ